jgi:hypothetical protein
MLAFPRQTAQDMPGFELDCVSRLSPARNNSAWSLDERCCLVRLVLRSARWPVAQVRLAVKVHPAPRLRRSHQRERRAHRRLPLAPYEHRHRPRQRPRRPSRRSRGPSPKTSMCRGELPSFVPAMRSSRSGTLAECCGSLTEVRSGRLATSPALSRLPVGARAV